jgi:hypothetical protein
VSETLLKRRLIICPLFCVGAVVLIISVADDAALPEMVLPGLLVGALISLVVAWLFVTADRRKVAHRSRAKVGVGVLLGGSGVGGALSRAPDDVLLVVGVLCLALCLGMTLSAGYELWRGTYAEKPAG